MCCSISMHQVYSESSKSAVEGLLDGYMEEEVVQNNLATPGMSVVTGTIMDSASQRLPEKSSQYSCLEIGLV